MVFPPERRPVLDTFSGQSLRSTSGKIGVDMEIAFNMRHRLMCVLEKILDGVC